MRISRNVGTMDSAIRIGIAALFLYVGLASNLLKDDPISNALTIAIGVVFLLTAIFGVCPAYNFLGINTCSLDNATSKKRSSP